MRFAVLAKRLAKVAVVDQRLVDEATEAKKLVVVAFVEVELREVKFWKVLEPVTRRFESEVKPPVAVSVPVKFAAEEMVWPFTVPEVMLPVLREVEKRFVEEAVVEKRLVEVAFVVVERVMLSKI